MRVCISVDYISEGTIPTFPSQFKPSKRDIQKMTEYYGKGSNPKTLANTVKDLEKALSRYYIAVATGWNECAYEFYGRCLDLGLDDSYIKEVREKAKKDKSIYIGDMDKSDRSNNAVSKPSTKVDKPAGVTPKPQKSVSNTQRARKTIDADTGFIITGNGNTPFS